MLVFFFFKQKTAYEMRISDWSSDVCSSDLLGVLGDDRVGMARAVACDMVERGLGAVDDRRRQHRREIFGDRKSVVSGKSVSVRVDLGGRRFIKKKKTNKIQIYRITTTPSKHEKQDEYEM